MPKNKAPSHVGDPSEGKGVTTNNNDHPRQRPRPNTAGDRKTRAGGGGVAFDSDDRSSNVIGDAGNRSNRHFSDRSSTRSNFEALFFSSSDEEDAGNEVEGDSGEEEGEIPNAAVATAASSTRPRRGDRVAYNERLHDNQLERQIRTSSDEFDSSEEEEEEEEENAIVEEDWKPAANVKNFSEFETKSSDGSEDSRLGDDAEESEDEAGAVDNSSYDSSDEENKANRKKGGQFGPCEAKKKAVRQCHLFSLFLFQFVFVLIICSISYFRC